MSSASSTIKQNPTLLIVHNEIAARAKLRDVFEDSGYRALMVSDAPSAWRTLHREQCDLILVDLEIPGVDGLALCRLLRAQQATRKLPVIALSDSGVETRKEEAFAAGVNDFITKTSSAGELVSRVASQLLAAQREWELIGSNRDLRFLADLGRGLLRALEPEQLVRRLAGQDPLAHARTPSCLPAGCLPSSPSGPIRTGTDEGAVRQLRVARALFDCPRSLRSPGARLPDPVEHSTDGTASRRQKSLV